MFHTFHFCALVSLTTALSIGPICAAAQKTNPSFNVSIAVPKTTLTSGSAIRVDITLTNQTNQLVLVEGLRSGPKGAGLRIWDRNGKALDPKGEAKERADRIPAGFGSAVPPNGKTTEFVNIANWFDVTKPGEYILQVRKRDPISRGWVESNKVTITIVPKSE